MFVCFRRDGASLQRFLEDYFAGRLKRYIKSEPIPEKNSGAVKVSKTNTPKPFVSINDVVDLFVTSDLCASGGGSRVL